MESGQPVCHANAPRYIIVSGFVESTIDKIPENLREPLRDIVFSELEGK